MDEPENLLTSHRRRLKLRQSDLAEAIGVRPNVVSMWETGALPVPAERAEQLVRALGLNGKAAEDLRSWLRDRERPGRAVAGGPRTVAEVARQLQEVIPEVQRIGTLNERLDRLETRMDTTNERLAELVGKFETLLALATQQKR